MDVKCKASLVPLETMEKRQEVKQIDTGSRDPGTASQKWACPYIYILKKQASKYSG